MGVLKMLANAASRQRRSLGSDFVKRETSHKELDMGLSCVFKKCKIKDSEPKHHWHETVEEDSGFFHFNPAYSKYKRIGSDLETGYIIKKELQWKSLGNALPGQVKNSQAHLEKNINFFF